VNGIPEWPLFEDAATALGSIYGPNLDETEMRQARCSLPRAVVTDAPAAHTEAFSRDASAPAHRRNGKTVFLAEVRANVPLALSKKTVAPCRPPAQAKLAIIDIWRYYPVCGAPHDRPSSARLTMCPRSYAPYTHSRSGLLSDRDHGHCAGALAVIGHQQDRLRFQNHHRTAVGAIDSPWAC